MARTRRRRRGKNSTGKNVLGILLIGVVISAFSVLGIYAFIESQKPGYDPKSLCPENGVNGHLAILVDTTDPISMTQLQAARQLILEKIENVAPGTRVSFSTVSPEREVRSSAFYTMCKPQSKEDANFWTQNAKLIKEQYDEKFISPVKRSLNDLLMAEGASFSPIMESLQEFITSIPGFLTDGASKELIIFSDLIQHTDTHSFYRNLSWESFESDGSASRLSRNFFGAKVTVLKVPSSATNVSIVDDFWVRYFNAQGFDDVEPRIIGNL